MIKNGGGSPACGVRSAEVFGDSGFEAPRQCSWRPAVASPPQRLAGPAQAGKAQRAAAAPMCFAGLLLLLLFLCLPLSSLAAAGVSGQPSGLLAGTAGGRHARRRHILLAAPPSPPPPPPPPPARVAACAADATRPGSYYSRILADSPFSWWRLQESSGTTAYDVSPTCC